MALTEHGNVTSHVALEKAATKYGIKPIFGLEAYCAPENMREQKNRRKWHMTLLAQTQEGYQNLLRLVTRSWDVGYYQWPTIHGSWLQEMGEGIIALSGCLDSKLACDLLGGKGRETGDERDAIKTMLSFQRIFGDRFYLEAQQFPELPRAHKLNDWYAQQSKRHGIPLVATSDCHYPMPDDNEMQVVLHTAGRGLGPVDTAESQWEYDIRLCPPSSDAAIIKRLRGTGMSLSDAQQAVENTNIIANRCNVKLQKAKNLRFPLPRGVKSSTELAWAWLREGWKFRAKSNKYMFENKDKYLARLKYEMELIESKDYLDYFLMLSDAVRWAKGRGIPVGPARGSAAASLACYLWRITEIDPVPFPHALFERFIDATRTDLPDVDLDFDDERRDELRMHLVELYGEDRVGNVGTFTKYKAKNSLDDVARVHRIPAWEVKQVKEYIIERSGGDARADETLADTIESFDKAKEVMERNPDLYKAIRLEGNYKGMSVHAAGLVISNDPITDTAAYYTQTDKKTGHKRQVLSVNKHDAEYLNLLKADFLGLKTMGQIRYSLEMIGMDLEDLYRLPYDLPEVIEAFRKNDVVGIFQYSGLATRIVNRDVGPDNFLELCDVNALSRPGPLHSGTAHEYKETKWGRMDPTHFHPLIDDMTMHTQYQIIYQEQMLRILKEVGNFEWTHVNQIRSIISKKYGDSAFNEKKEMFLQGAKDTHGIDKKLAEAIWKRLVTAGSYAFNFAHCLSYSTLAYWQMWMKVHHPDAFYAGNLIKFTDTDDQYALLRDALEHGLSIKPPDINTSGVSWSASNGVLMGGLRQVKGVGEVMAKNIIEDRETNGKFQDLKEITRIKGVGPGAVAKFKAMQDSSDPYDIKRIDIVMAKVRRAIDNGDLPFLMPRHRAEDLANSGKDDWLRFIGIPLSRHPQDVIENERARTGATEEAVLENLKDPDLRKKMYLVCQDDSPEQAFIRFSRYEFPKFEKAIWENLNLGHDVIYVEGRRGFAYGNSMNVKKMAIIDPDEL